MDDELRAFLEDRFGRLEHRMGAFEHRMDAFERRIDGIEQRMDAFERRMDGIERRMDAFERRMDGIENRMDGLGSETSRLGVLLESVQEQVRLVAEGHGILYRAIDRQYEEVRAELRDVRGLLRVWNDLVTRRLADLEYRMREKVG